MKRISIKLAVTFVGMLTAGVGSAKAAGPGEPAFCSPTEFSKLEFKTRGGMSLPGRLHTYRLGRAVFAGMAVGNSSVASVQNVANTHGTAKASEGFCTWYFNDGNQEAQKAFNWRFLNNPSGLTEAQAVKEYSAKLEAEFSAAANNFVTCADQHKYLGMGCDGMKHRGPTVFGMVLAYVGCDPNNAVDIADGIWGLNGVPKSTRVALAKVASGWGLKNPDAAARLRAVFENK